MLGCIFIHCTDSHLNIESSILGAGILRGVGVNDSCELFREVCLVKGKLVGLGRCLELCGDSRYVKGDLDSLVVLTLSLKLSKLSIKLCYYICTEEIEILVLKAIVVRELFAFFSVTLNYNGRSRNPGGCRSRR